MKITKTPTTKQKVEPLQSRLIVCLTPKELELIQNFAGKEYLRPGRYARNVLIRHCIELSKLEEKEK